MCVLVSYLEVYTQSCKVPKFLVLPNCSGLNRENGEKYRFKAKVGKSMRNNRDAPGPEQPSRYPPSTYKSARIYIMTFWNTDFIPAGQTGRSGFGFCRDGTGSESRAGGAFGALFGCFLFGLPQLMNGRFQFERE